MRGLKNALLNALPNSPAFLFTDAGATDYPLYDEVAELIQRRQSPVTIFLAEECEQPNPQFKVYSKIARTGGGQILRMKSENIGEVLESMSITIESDFVSLKAIDSDEAGTSVTTLEVDATIRRLSVSLSGKNAKLSIKDSRNVEVTSNDTFSSPNIQIVNFDVIDNKVAKFDSSTNKYTIEVSAESEFSVRIGALSDLQFDFGFSRQQASSQADTYIRPVIGHENILSIFVSDSSLIKCLVRAFIVPANPSESFDEIEIPLNRKNGFFSSNLLEIPKEMFRIRIFGYDSTGNVIDRVISTGIESVDTSEFSSSFMLVCRHF